MGRELSCCWLLLFFKRIVGFGGQDSLSLACGLWPLASDFWFFFLFPFPLFLFLFLLVMVLVLLWVEEVEALVSVGKGDVGNTITPAVLFNFNLFFEM